MKARTAPGSVLLVLRDYWQLTLRCKWLAFPGMLLPGIGNIFVLYIPPLIVVHLLERFKNASQITPADALPYIVAFALVWTTGEAIWRVALHLMIKFQARGIAELYKKAMAHLLEKELAFFSDNFTGSLTKKSISYARNFEGVTDTMALNVIVNLLPMPFAAVILWRYSPWLVVILFGMIAIAIVALVPLIKRRQKLVVKREAASNVLSGHISDVITNVSVVHAFANDDQECAFHHRNVDDYVRKMKRTWDFQNLRIDMIASPLYVIMNVTGLAVAIMIGGEGGVSLSAVFVTFNYYMLCMRVLWEFSHIYRRLESSVTEAAQFTELLLEEPKVDDVDSPRELVVSAGAISFKNVAFSYDDGKGGALLQDFDLEVKAGEKVGLVGHSGGGKTTLTKLLLRFMDIQDGSIDVDGHNIAEVRQVELRRHIAYVPQEPMLFHRSLRENISYARPRVSLEEIRVAAKKAHALEFIDKFPRGMETLVGERGVKLSGGQRQRIAIARAILKNAPILVLDEATSALDSESEKEIQAALWELMQGRTSIVIAHRLSTIQRMDRILVLEEGRIVESGTHQQLIARDGIYARLWAHQSGGFIDE